MRCASEVLDTADREVHLTLVPWSWSGPTAGDPSLLPLRHTSAG